MKLHGKLGDEWMITNGLQPQVISDLKNRFFDLLTVKSNRSYERFITDIAEALKDALKTSYSGVYLYNEWDDHYELISRLDEEDKVLVKTPFTQKEWEDFQKDTDHLYDNILNGDCLFSQGNHLRNFIIPLHIENRSFGFLLFSFPMSALSERFYQDLEEIGFEVLKILMKMESYFKTIAEENKYELLFRVTSKFHSSMNMDDVLAEIIETLREIYPKFEYYLLLSHDYSSNHNLPIKELKYDNDITSKASAQAYLTGQIQFEDRMKQRQSCFYAPLKGKQGVYGVLQVVAPNSMLFPSKDIEFITLLANTAGNALENARLYQQSKRLISDLQLINETSHKLNSNLRLSETISFMAKQITQSFHAEEVGLILFNDGDVEDYQVLGGSTKFFQHKDSSSFVEHINSTLRNHQDALFVGDFSMKNPTINCSYQSVMAIPMIQRGDLKGVVNVLHTSPYFFSFETFKLLQSLVHHSTLAFTNSMLREELEKLVQTDYLTKLYSRKHIDETIKMHINNGGKGTFAILDIDNFKLVNDRYGHQVGDQVIIKVSQLIKEQVGETGIVARWGGEELGVYFPNKNIHEGAAIAEKLRKEVESSTNPPVTISCGLSYWHVDGDDNLKDYFIRADKALYHAKESGKNRVCLEESIRL